MKDFKDLKDLKVAIVQDYLSEFGGAEGVCQAIWEIFPQAHIYTAAYDAKLMAKIGVFRGARVFYPHWPTGPFGSLQRLLHLLFIANLPLYFENLDLRGYDLIISSTAHFAKGVLTRPDQLHISYIHTVPRFLYGYPGESRKRDQWPWKFLVMPLNVVLRILDYAFAQRPDFLVCNSREVQSRIKKFYRREAVVINPFPQVNMHVEDSANVVSATVEPRHGAALPRSKTQDTGYYLVVSRQAAYKNIDLIIHTCGKSWRPLKVAGTGSSAAYLRQVASQYPCVEMLGTVSEEEKVKLYQNCRAVIGAVKDEDFGMAALEPMVFGKPVVVLREAGYLETVTEGVSGVFFEDLTEESLLAGLQRLEETTWNVEEIKMQAAKFSKERFQREFKSFVVERFIAH